MLKSVLSTLENWGGSLSDIRENKFILGILFLISKQYF